MWLFKKNTAGIIIAPTPAILITSDKNMKKSQNSGKKIKLKKTNKLHKIKHI